MAQAADAASVVAQDRLLFEMRGGGSNNNVSHDSVERVEGETTSCSLFSDFEDTEEMTSPLPCDVLIHLFNRLINLERSCRQDLISQLEMSHLLERRIWSNFPPSDLPSLADNASDSPCLAGCVTLPQSDDETFGELENEMRRLNSCIMVITMIFNEKFRQRANVWSVLEEDEQEDVKLRKFRVFFYLAWYMFLYPLKFALQSRELAILVQLFIHVFQSLEQDIVRRVCMPLCSPASWLHLSHTQQAHLLDTRPELRRLWKSVGKRYKLLASKTRDGQHNDPATREASGTLSPSLDREHLSLEDRFLLLERDGMVLALRYVLRLVEHEIAPRLLPENILTTSEQLALLPKTAVDVFAGTHYIKMTQKNNRQQKSMLQKERENKKSSGSVPRSGAGATSTIIEDLRNESTQDVSNDELLLCERFLEFLIDLMSQLPTRRFFRPVFLAQQFLPRLRLSRLYYHTEAALIRQLAAILTSYEVFEIDDHTGEPLPFRALEGLHYQRLKELQLVAFQHFQNDFPELKKMALAPISKYETPEALRGLFKSITVTALLQISDALHLVDALSFAQDALEPLFALLAARQNEASEPKREALSIEVLCDTDAYRTAHHLLVEVLVNYLHRREDTLSAINALPLFPTETLLWDPNIIPTEHYQGDFSLALPKLNLQFLTVRDYLMRNFHLFRLESAYEIRQDLEESVARKEPCLAATLSSTQPTPTAVTFPYTLLQRNAMSTTHVLTANGSSNSAAIAVSPAVDPYATHFRGTCRRAVPIDRFSVIFVKSPALGQKVPSEVRAEVSVDLRHVPMEAREEWDALRPYDALFLVAVRVPPTTLLQEEPLNLSALRQLKSVAQFPERFGVLYVRGCEVVDILDEEGQSFSQQGKEEVTLEGVKKNRDLFGTVRTYRVLLDTYQYDYDVNDVDDVDVYSSLNLLVRRPAAENNFKPILETVRQLMNDREHAVIPTWLHDLFLGYGDPTSAQYFRNPQWHLPVVDFYDTFLDADHLRASFPDIQHLELFTPNQDDSAAHRPWLVRMEFPQDTNNASSVDADNNGGCPPAAGLPAFHPPEQRALARVYCVSPRGPYPTCAPRLNSVRFTRAQVEAIRSGVHPGLTLIVGPPGTGKTDTAVQIAHLLHKNFPTERILLIAHSNQALNDLFEKIAALDIDERYLLRLGMGEKELREASDNTLRLAGNDTQRSSTQRRRDFSKWGRVNHMLQRRLDLLKKVDHLGACLQVPGDVGASCETAIQFYRSHIMSRIQRFWRLLTTLGPNGKGLRVALRDIREADKTSTAWITKRQAAAPLTEPVGRTASSIPSADTDHTAPLCTIEEMDDRICEQVAAGTVSLVQALFPFSSFFSDVPNALFPKNCMQGHRRIAQQCFAYLEDMFQEVEECHAFELLRTLHDRTEYLVTRHAKVIAMTCTHAALARRQLVAMRFTYDTLIMEEAAQILEVETFVPMVLQQADSSGISRLKRVVLLGDHHQLPPVVKNRGFQQYGQLDQSMYTRLIRLQVPYIQLDAQGRCRPELRALFGWRYTRPSLTDLPAVREEGSCFRKVNPGFLFTHQWINVPDYQGQGETLVPYQQHMYQNLGEAEFVVAVFMYMRLLGYPAESIALLTMYNGQKQLLKDIVRKRCAWNPAIGWPAVISTVDRFQGQQADYVLLSLVRTRKLGYLRDVRRMIVAVSRARLGLYVFGRLPLLRRSHELNPIVAQLTQHIISLTKPQNNEALPLALVLGETAADPLPCCALSDSEDTVVSVARHRSPQLVPDVTVMWDVLQWTTRQALAKITAAPDSSGETAVV